jgi:hypothetical protein
MKEGCIVCIPAAVSECIVFDYCALPVDLSLQPAFSLSFPFRVLVPSHGFMQRSGIQQESPKSCLW